MRLQVTLDDEPERPDRVVVELEPEPAAGRGRRRRRRWPWLLAPLILFAGAGTLVLRPWRSTSPYAAPASVPLPPAAGKATADYLAGPQGMLLDRFIATTAPVTGPVDADRCLAITHALDGVAAPKDVLGAASGIPDGPTAEMAVSHVSAVTHFLGSCIVDGHPAARDQVVFTATVLDRRLRESR